MRFKPKWLKFIERGFKNQKTKIWHICSDRDGMISEIKWIPRWRKYGFFPKDNTFWEQACLRDIANFIEQETKNFKLK